MGKLKNLMIDIETLGKNYSPFKPPEPLEAVQVLGSQINPAMGLLEGREWIPAAQTDVTRTWRKFGWRPLAEIAADKGEP
jgi:hypothetical protein